MNPAPCMDCKDRVFGCWANCERYAEWNAQREAARDARKKVRSRENMLTNFKAESIRKTKGKK